MTATDKLPPARKGSAANRRGALRIAGHCGIAATALAVFFLVAVSGLYLKLASGPIDLGGYVARVETSLASRLGPGWHVSIRETALELRGLKPAIRTNGLEIRNSRGVAVVRAPYAVVSLNPLSLLVGDFSPREIELRDLHLRGVIAADGSLSFSTPADPAPEAPQPAAEAPAASAERPAPSIVSSAAMSLLRPLVSPSGVIGALDRAVLVDAGLSLVGPEGRERVAFDGVDAVFEKVEGSDRRFEIELRGQHGAWRAAGRVSGAKGHASLIEAHGVPIADLMLLGGLSKAPASSDVKLSGSLSAFFSHDRLARLQARLGASQGRIERKDRSPVHLDDASVDLVWDEAGRNLDIASLGFRSEGTQVALKGRLGADPQGDWRLALDGRDAMVADLDPARPPFRLASIEARAQIEEGRLGLDSLTVRGEGVELAMSGVFTPGHAEQVFTGLLDATNTDARKLVRLWPDSLNPSLRRYLAARLAGGTVQTLHLRSKLDQKDFKTVFNDDPMSDGALDLTFTTSDTRLDVVDGLPPLAGLAIQGHITGVTASLDAAGAIEMADGRRLSFTEASYVHPSLDRKGSPAQIGFRIQGGADALASLARSPLIREAGVPDLDPATLRGAVDVKATLPLVPGAIPPLRELGIAFSGTFSDISADKLPGQERLEGGQFSVLQDAAGFSAKGEGKLGGAPASFTLRAPQAGGGELTVTTVLDEAGRARRSLPVAPALAGPVGVKVTVPLGAKPVPRVELDLSRAAIDGLVPGWQKPAGKPGRAAFTINDTGSTELHDLAVEAGSVQMKGSLVLAAAGGVERADLSSFRLSPGDDMRVQLERAGSGYRVTIRGGNADARPLLKWLGAPSAKGGGRESHDSDIDLAVSILSGFNDEAMTSVTAKASTRGGELRSLQFGGKFRSAPLEASVARRDGGAPVLTMRAWDAGATLRFLDFYRRMAGGRLGLEARLVDGGQQGQVTIEDFALRGEPALRRIVSQSQQGGGGSEERGLAPVARQDVDQVLFTRLTTSFRRAGTRMEYADAVIYGTQVGFNLSGWVDTARDRLDISGTFVPAYIVNNAFSQLPVVGLILGGGSTEGLIAVDFRVSGALSGPSVTVNPLTAVAPGILRKLFGWMMPEGQAIPEASAAQRPPARRRAR